ncbi:hypothetical protein ACIF8T_16155 [Streptomyces sp. NPDC085946]|uniref:hypothetical protein n=1 Tax=Streptomyces sp. NPDC085946 TaxID=3365744 RepID=UPI0037D68941
MPFPPPPRTPSGPRRRSLLVVTSTAVALTGCSAGAEDPDGTGGGRPSADDRARARAARDSAALAERYDAVLAAHPGLAPRLRPLREEVARHAEAFGGRATGTRSAPASPSASASPGVSPSVSPSAAASPSAAVPGNEKDALALLAAAERDLADRRAEELVRRSGELARLLASVAAAGAAHVYLLTEGDR